MRVQQLERATEEQKIKVDVVAASKAMLKKSPLASVNSDDVAFSESSNINVENRKSQVEALQPSTSTPALPMPDKEKSNSRGGSKNKKTREKEGELSGLRRFKFEFQNDDEHPETHFLEKNHHVHRFHSSACVSTNASAIASASASTSASATVSATVSANATQTGTPRNTVSAVSASKDGAGSVDDGWGVDDGCFGSDVHEARGGSANLKQVDTSPRSDHGSIDSASIAAQDPLQESLSPLSVVVVDPLSVGVPPVREMFLPDEACSDDLSAFAASFAAMKPLNVALDGTVAQTINEGAAIGTEKKTDIKLLEVIKAAKVAEDNDAMKYIRLLLRSDKVGDKAKAARFAETIEEALDKVWLLCNQVALLLMVFHDGNAEKTQFGTYRVELLVNLFSKIIDVHNFNVISNVLTTKEYACFVCRVGLLKIFDPLEPDGPHELTLSRCDFRTCYQ